MLSHCLGRSAEAGNGVAAKSLTKGSLTKGLWPQCIRERRAGFLFVCFCPTRKHGREKGVVFRGTSTEPEHAAILSHLQPPSDTLRGKVGKELGKEHPLYFLLQVATAGWEQADWWMSRRQVSLPRSEQAQRRYGGAGTEPHI